MAYRLYREVPSLVSWTWVFGLPMRLMPPSASSRCAHRADLDPPHPELSEGIHPHEPADVAPHKGHAAQAGREHGLDLGGQPSGLIPVACGVPRPVSPRGGLGSSVPAPGVIHVVRGVSHVGSGPARPARAGRVDETREVVKCDALVLERVRVVGLLPRGAVVEPVGGRAETSAQTHPHSCSYPFSHLISGSTYSP